MADSPRIPMDVSVTDHLLATTRAVRKRLDLERPVEPEVILECLRLAVQAPTGSNTQGWRWIVVTDPEKRAALKELYGGTGGAYLKSAASTAKDPQTKRVYESAVYLLDILDRVPVHVIPCIEGRVESAATLANASFYGSILPAVWSFMLALRSRGLGSVWTTLAPRAGAGGGRAPRHPRGLHAGRTHPGGLHHGWGLQARSTPTGRARDVLGHLGRHRRPGLTRSLRFAQLDGALTPARTGPGGGAGAGRRTATCLTLLGCRFPSARWPPTGPPVLSVPDTMLWAAPTG